MSADTASAMSFSARIREASWARHQGLDPASASEGDRGPGLFDRLFEGSLSAGDYTRWHAQQYFVYAAIESAGDRLAADPVAGPFVFAELARLASLESDLEFLMGPKWRSGIAPLESTRAYVDRVTEASATPGGYIAHAYTRYLGDLSGGQAFGKAARRAYGFENEGASFYVFTGIESPKAFKDEYRARLDAVDLDEDAKDALVAEILLAYDHNGAVLAELGANLDRNPFDPKVIAAICHHMNHDHADDTLVICRGTGGRREASGARMTGFDGEGADFAAAVGGEEVPVRIEWARPLTERAEVRPEIVRIFTESRELLGARPLPFRNVLIVATRRAVTNLPRPASAALPWAGCQAHGRPPGARASPRPAAPSDESDLDPEDALSDTGPVAAASMRRHAARPHRTRGQHRASWAAELSPLLAGTQRRYTAVVGSAVAGASVVAMATAAGMPSGDEPAPSRAVDDIAALAAEASVPEGTAPGADAADEGAAASPAAAAADAAAPPERTTPVTGQDAQIKWKPMLDEITITSLFGQRWGRNHNGVDFDAETGDPVYAAYPGTVKHAGWESGFGNLVIIDHGDGVETYYAHNSAVSVSPGDWVDSGTHIADAGNTGFSFGSHVHFEVHVDGRPVEPLDYLSGAGLDLR
ncbi:Heme oxygenase [Glycomyces sambucus]|uniref:Heme oxygenase n=1 Tax=Glycomyces sambucus TaxID=380244 RepID=A0A1G9JLX7_9ACTN|nr:biliverdin-producing heme oxygenase [Glycomyces sambucus]SDL38431.1 Heme oxygenase [Glycomyces sambucus]